MNEPISDLELSPAALEVIDLAHRVITTGRPRRFVKNVHALVKALAAVPDSAVEDWPPYAVAMLTLRTEIVVDAIESQLDLTDTPEFQRALAAAIYDIRRELETINAWTRHYHPIER